MIESNIKVQLAKKGITQLELARLVDHDKQLLNNIINNRKKTIQLDLMDRIATVLECSISDLFKRS